MSIIIRLQNLPWDASAINIRQFFYGLSIPDGGVHIIGGDKGDAFIAFSTDEDARQAMRNDGGFIGSTPVRLFLSSKTEMQSVIAAAREGSTITAAAGAPRPSMDPGQFQRGKYGMTQNQPSIQYGQSLYGTQRDNNSGGFEPKSGSFLQQQQQQQQIFNRLAPNDYKNPVPSVQEPRFPSFGGAQRPQGMDPRPFDNRQPLADVAPRGITQIQFNPKQPFHEQRQLLPPPVWNDPNSQQLYEPFGVNMEKQGGYPSFKKPLPPPERSLLPAPGEGLGKREDWGRQNESLQPRDFGGRQSDNFFRPSGAQPLMDFERGARGPDSKRNGPDRPPSFDGQFEPVGGRFEPVSGRFEPVGGRGLGPNAPRDTRFERMGQPNESGRNEEFWPGENVPRFGANSFPPRKEEGPNFEGGNRANIRNDFQEFRGFCIFVRDLPHSFGPREIRSVFRNCDIPSSRLNIIYDRNGQKVGHAYIRLSSPEELDAALRENGQLIDGRRIRVTRCHERDFEEAGRPPGGESRSKHRSRSRSPMKNSSGSDGYFAVIKNLPGPSFIKKCLTDIKVARNGGPFMEIGRNGKETGNALVELEHRKDLSMLLERHKTAYSGHLTYVYSINRTEFKTRIKDARQLAIEEVELDKQTCLEVDGLPWSSTDEKVRKFFSGLKIATNGVHIFSDHAGKATGLGFLEFESSSDCSKAMEKHKQYMDNRYLILRIISKSEMVSQIEKHLKTGGRLLTDNFNWDKKSELPSIPPLMGVMGPGDVGAVVYMKNLSHRTQLEDIIDFFGGYTIIRDSIKLQYKDDIPTGDGMVEFVSRREAEDAVKKLAEKPMLGKPIKLLF